MSRTHLAAIAALASASMTPALPVFDTAVEKPNYNPLNWTGAWTAAQRDAWVLPTRYLILSAPTLRTEAESLDDVPRDVRDYVRVTTVDPSARGARLVQEAVRDDLDRSHPVVTGYSTNLRHSTADVFAKDGDGTTDLYYAVDTYLYHATPAT